MNEPTELTHLIAHTLRAASLAGLSRELQAAAVADAVKEWLSRPEHEPNPSSIQLEIDSATRGAVDCRAVAMTVKIEPLLALRLLEYALASKQTLSGAVQLLLGESIDKEFMKVCRQLRLPAPLQWDNGQPL